MGRGVAIGGFMGSGKSSVGRGLAARLGLPFVDLDGALEAAHGPIPRQLAEEGEARFRAREQAMVVAICADPAPRVLATGGGTWIHAPSRALLRRRFHMVVLSAPFETLRSRVGEGEGRPLWDAQARRRLADRREAYEDADLVVDTEHLTVDEVAAEIEAWVRRRECP